MCDKIAIIDIQFIVDKKLTFVKELAVYNFCTKETNVYLFLPPYPKSYLNYSSLKQNTYNIYFLHGFDWNDGELKYEQVSKILETFKDFKIFVKGVQKKFELEKYNLKNVVDIDTDIPSLHKNDNLTCYCTAHKKVLSKNIVCSLKNVIFIKDYVINTCLLYYWESKKKDNEK